MIAESYGQNDKIFNSNYISIKPINYLVACPNIQFGIKRALKESDSRRKFSELSFTYPYGKSYYENLISTAVIKKFQLVGLQSQWFTRIMNKRRQEKNKFWGPVIEFVYINYRKESLNNYTGYNIYKENYLLFCLGFHNGRYFNSKSGKIMQALHWGAAFRFVKDFAHPGQKLRIGYRDENVIGIKVYLSLQLGRQVGK
jgi:hypothetical protein